jgi:hypothetical protein
MKKLDRRSLTKRGDGIDAEPDPVVVWGLCSRVHCAPEASA